MTDRGIITRVYGLFLFVFLRSILVGVLIHLVASIVIGLATR